ncbi:uncharacterized protein At1g01500-like [Phragmites australis]|uniref:uncharacterized protein At1g01500-like n=1 Tax=Phragmites australis TaxID=29695 RepID=UPI002D767C3E|nr:uncharacterized protein At1g01500-like [Phragmites australis]XP_062216304.1 uncharacterized protein At1g01500-like [Phragmites australis]XP_062216305.1 uncharacterized protein At1g01500-like [Phragmites australis]
MGDIPEPGAAMTMPEPLSCLTLRVFYLRVSRCEVDESMLDTLTLTHTPLTPDTVLKAGGRDQQPGVSNGNVSCTLRRDRVDAASEEVTFVSTETVRMAGSVRFEVQNKDERLLVGILEMCDAESLGGDVTMKEKSGGKKKSWVMKFQVATQRGSGFLRSGRETKLPPTVEVYVAGVSRGTPIVFTKAMQLRFRRRRQVKAFMDPIPECGEQAEDTKEMAQKHDPEESEYRCYKPDPDADDNESLYMRSAGPEGEEYSELSWFTAGVRVGVGISLGICLGVGIGAGLLVRSYQSTSRTLKRRLISSLL